MHFLIVVVVPNGTQRDEAEEIVRPLMEPYSEMTSDDGWWDWFQIGGRWTGVYAEYDASADPANTEVCRLCGGTGERRDMTLSIGCNGCRGAGVAQKWPTQWQPFDGDIVPVKVLLNNDGIQLPWGVVTPDGAVQRECWTGDEWDEDDDWPNTLRAALEPFVGESLAVVDCHS